MPKRTDISKIQIIGSGPIIGQSAEFDRSVPHASKVFKFRRYRFTMTKVLRN
jgi:hypothetical protein